MTEKTFYELSTEVTTEELNKRRGQISECAWLTAQYLKRLHEAPNINACFREKRYRG